MGKSSFLAAAAILAVMGSMVAVKSFAPATSTAPAQHRAVAPAAAGMRPVLPSPIIDTSGEVLVGTGDRAAGAWVRP
jgi:hypothetical protein